MPEISYFEDRKWRTIKTVNRIICITLRSGDTNINRSWNDLIQDT